MLTALVLGGTRNGITYISQMCAEIPGLIVVRSLDRLPKLHNLGRVLNAFAPELVILEACDDEPWMELAQLMIDHHPGTPLLAFSMAKNHAALAGALGLLTLEAPFSGEDFQETVFRSLSRTPVGFQGRLIAFMPAKGGVGATTTALAAATMVAQRLSKKVLFLECDVQSGPVGFYLNLQPKHSMMSILADSLILDRQPITELTTRSNGIDVLPSMGLRHTNQLSAWSCQRLLSRARSIYDFVFCDLPEGTDDTFEPVLRGADRVVIITTPAAPSIRLTERRLAALSLIGVSDAKISLVVNRIRPREPVVEGIRQYRVSASIPYRSMLMDAPSFDLKRSNGNELGVALHQVAEICVGHSISRHRQRFSVASLWRTAMLGWRGSRSEGARG